MRQLEAVDAFVSDTDDVFFDGIKGIGPRLMSVFDFHVHDSASIHNDDLDALDTRSRRSFLLLALHIVSPIHCVGLVNLPRRTTLRCAPRTPMSATVSSPPTFTMGPKL